jgi:hypothetical protein
MTRWQRILSLGATAAVSALLAAACAGSAHAPAARTAGVSPNLQSILQDDLQLLYASPQNQAKTLEEMKAIGVGVVKVSLIWYLMAPDPHATHAPAFNGSNPSAYPWGSWSRYDQLDEVAHSLGLRVYFQIVPGDPAWGVAHDVPSGQSHQWSMAPNLRYFGQFVRAVGSRYSGTWHDTQGHVIPRVDYWGIWNEPNNWGSLNPWYRNFRGRRQLIEPWLYRGIANTTWNALSATGHRNDTILLGETANYGTMPPISFLQDLYCVGPSYRQLTGRSAQAVGCPASISRSKFVAEDPGLFRVTGWAHHPYGFDLPPNAPYPVKVYFDGTRAREITLYNINQLEGALGRAFAAYHRNRPGGIPLYLTEWGYVTNPPNILYKTTPSDQATWLDQGEYMAWHDSYVKALAQFNLVDPGTARKQTYTQWKFAFTTGLYFQNRKPKPALGAYRLPIWLPVARHGAHVPVWGQLRPANHALTQRGLIQFRGKGSSAWRTLQRVQTTSSQGFFLTHVAIRSPGRVRLAWQDPAGQTYYSRAASVS